MATASEEFLVRFKYWLVRGGMMTRKACGNPMSRISRPWSSPSAAAASVCPAETEAMPERTTSAIKAAVYIVKPISSARNSGVKAPPFSTENSPLIGLSSALGHCLGLGRADRSRSRARARPGPGDSAHRIAAGLARHHSAADQPVFEPDQEFFAGGGHWLPGYRLDSQHR